MSVEMKSTLEPAQGIDYRTSSIYKRVLPWHAHPDFCICLVEKGRMSISKGSISYFLQAGDVGFFNPNEIHNTCLLYTSLSGRVAMSSRSDRTL